MTSISGKQAQWTTAVMAGVPGRKRPVAERDPAGKPVMALDHIERALKSKLSLTNKDGHEFRAELAFQGNLRKYVHLQGQAWGEQRKLSSIISFTSAGSNVDALALPTGRYVSDTWEQEGVRLLRMIEKALDDTKNHGVSGFLSQNSHVSVTVYDKYLLLKIKGEKDSFPKIIEQVCWVVSVAGQTSISLLEKYTRETSGGKKTRGYAETLHAGKPVITAGTDGRLKVSFSPSRAEIHENNGVVAKTGNCWKTMAGLSIVATGYAIPKRPRQGSGLEAPLFVLRQLFKRGCRGPVVPLDKPMVMVATEVAGKGHEAYWLRMIMAVGAQQCTPGNAIYWHFDPARLCDSMGSCEQIEKEIRVGPSMIGPRSRHFVGWSSEAGLLAGTPKTNIKVLDCDLSFLPHYELVFPSASASFRIPPFLNITAGVAREKVDTLLPTDKMSSSRSGARTALQFHHFVLWDTQDSRGWLVNGQVAALHLLRGHLKYRAETKKYDFSKLKNISHETPSAVEDLLVELEKEKIPQPKNAGNNEENPKDVTPPKDQDDDKDFSIGEVLDTIYEVLEKMRDTTEKMYKHPGFGGPLRSWLEKRWTFTVRGWDFEELSRGVGAGVRLHKFHGDPGWLLFARELHASFLFGGDFGEIMRPRAGQCCPHFQTLPKHQDYLAVGLHTIQKLVDKHGVARMPSDTVAKLTHHDAWEHDVDPFKHAHGQGDHLDKVDSSCLPIQGLARIRHYPNDKTKDRDIVKNSKRRLYTWLEVDRMNTAPEDVGKEFDKRPANKGVVVFGNKPDAAKLRQLAQSSTQRSGSSGRSPTASATTAATSTQQPQAGATPRPSSSHSLRSSTSVSDARGAKNPTKAPEQPSVASARRAPSVSSMRSTTSSIHSDARAAGPGGERPQASNPQASPASAQRTPSVSSVRSTASSIGPKAPGTGQAQASSPQPLTSSTHKRPSNASLGGNNSIPRPRAIVADSGRPGEPTAEPKAPAAAGKPSNSSVRTTSSVDSRAAGGSKPQVPAGQTPVPALKRTTTDASDKTTSSRASRSTQSSAGGSTAANSRQRQRLDPPGAATAATTEGHHSTSSGPAPTAGVGQGG